MSSPLPTTTSTTGALAAAPTPATEASHDRVGYFNVAKAINNPTVLTSLSDLPRVPHNCIHTTTIPCEAVNPRYINVLAVVLGTRQDARKTRKKDYYIQDSTSIVLHHPRRRRKTVLSIWRDQDAFERDVKPGSIVALQGAAVNKNYEEDVAYKILRFMKEKVPHGHLNIYNDHPPSWYVCDPVNMPGYAELLVWRDQVLRRELQLEREEEEEEEERKRALKETANRQFEAAQTQRQEMADLNRIAAAEVEGKNQREIEEKEVEEMDREGLIWWKNGQPLWRIDGLY